MNGLPGQIAFISVALLTLSSALYVVTARNIIHAGFGLLPCFIGIAGIYAVLDAHFFVVVQILIYVGAIQILILFALMLTRNVVGRREPQTNNLAWPGAIICAATAAGASYILVRHPWGPEGGGVPDAHAQTAALGAALIGQYALPFEVASLLLLAALIGAVVLAKAEREPAPESPVLADTVEPEQPSLPVDTGLRETVEAH